MNQHAGKTHCKRGHEFNEENTIEKYRPDTDTIARECRTCRNLLRAERRARAKERTTQYE